MVRFGVTAFPTLFFLTNGRTWLYSGPRNIPAVRLLAYSFALLSCWAWIRPDPMSPVCPCR